MSGPQYNIFGKPLNDDSGLKLLHGLTNQKVQEAMDRAFTVFYELTSKQLETLADIFKPRLINIAANAQLHPHPIPAILQQYAYMECNNFSRGFKRSMDIGGSLHRTNARHHLCVKIDDSRTHARYLNAALASSKMTSHKPVRDHALYGHTFGCGNGAEFCTQQADYAYMINVYDIPVEMIPVIMQQHKTRVLDAWMFLPNALYDEKLDHDQAYYQCYMVLKGREKKRIAFSLGDQSTVYEHDYDNWRKYMFTTSISAPDHTIFVEHVRTLHTFTHIRFTRVEVPCTKRYFRRLNLPGSTDCTIVPNMRAYVKRGCNDHIFKHRIYADSRFVNAAFQYINRQKEHGLSGSNFFTYMDGKSASVQYQTGVQTIFVYKKIEQEGQAYLDLLTSLFILGMLMRERQSKQISEFVKLSQEMGKNNWWFQFKREISLMTQKVGDWIYEFFKNIDHATHMRIVESYDPYYMKDATAMPFNCPLVADRLVLQYKYGAFIYHQPLPVFNFKQVHGVSSTINVDDEEDEAKTSLVKKRATSFTLELIKSSLIGSSDYKCNMNVIYDPPGDGRCGVHALEKVAGKIVDHSTWHNDVELGKLANAAGYNLIAHTGGVIVPYIAGQFFPTIKVFNKSGHWQLVECDCSIYSYMVADYADVPVVAGNTYINCANEMCSDGAGQAKVFAAMFKGYKNTMTLPIKTTTHVHHDGCELIVALANNQRAMTTKPVHPVRNTTLMYDDMVNVINKHARGTVYLPLIGTGIFGCNLCCFKAACTKLTCNVVMVFHDVKQKADFDRARPCNSAGYVKLGTYQQPTIVKGMYSNRYYNKIAPWQIKDHMELKAQDLECFLIDKGIGRVIDIASAPGDFMKYMTKVDYVPFHFVGTGAFPKRTNYPAEEWYEPKVLFGLIGKFLDANAIRDSEYHKHCVLWDCPYTYNPKLHGQLCDMVRHTGIRYVTKALAYAEPHNFDTKGLCVELIRNEGSNALSSEVFMYIRQADVKLKSDQIDLGDVAITVDKFAYHRQQTHVCNCSKTMDDSMCNGAIQFTVGKTNSSVFKNYMRNDVVLKKDPESMKLVQDTDITGVYQLGTYNGIAGSRKTRNVLMNSCPKCTIIIAPFRSVVKDANETVASSAVTFVKAIALLSAHQYKYVFVDEVYHLNANFIALYRKLQPSAKMYGLGDPYQIPCCDFEDCAPIVSLELRGYLTRTHRFNNEVCLILKHCIPDVSTTSVDKSMIEIISTNNMSKGDMILTFTQAAKATFTKLGYTVQTVAESEGCTFKNVTLYADDYIDIRRYIGAYVYVGITRSAGRLTFATDLNFVQGMLDTLQPWFKKPHFQPIKHNVTVMNVKDWTTNMQPAKCSTVTTGARFAVDGKKEDVIESHGLELIEYGYADMVHETDTQQNNHISTLVINGDESTIDATAGTAVEGAIDFAQVVAVKDVNAAFVSHGNRINSDEKLRAFANENCDVAQMEEILMRFFVQSNSNFGVSTVAYNTNILRENKSGLNIRIDPRMLNTSDVELQGARMSNFQFVLQQCGKSSMSMIACILERYMAQGNIQDSAVMQKYLTGLESFMARKFDKCTTKENDELYASVLHYLKNLQEKISLKGKKNHWIQRTLKKITSNTRTITLPINHTEEDYEKEVQGVVHAKLRKGQKIDYIVSDTPSNVIDEEVININTQDFSSIVLDGRRIKEAPVSRWINKYIVTINGKDFITKGEEIRTILIANVDVHAIANDQIMKCTDQFRATLELLHSGDLDEVKMHEIQQHVNQRLLQGLAEEIGAESKAFNAYRELMREWYEPSQSVISFHLKTQPKEVRKEGYDTANKVGQGVSAWSKMLNCILASIESSFINEFKERLKPNVLLAIDRSDAEIAAWFAPYMQLYNNNNVVKTDADHTQFDCTQGNGLAALQEVVYNRMGFPARTTAWLIAMRAKYHATAMDAATMSYCTFDFMWQMTSGALYTLTWNTASNMAIIGACYDFGDIHVAAFKGDDVHIVSSKFKEKLLHNKPITTALGHKIKIQHPEVSEFLANIITPTGFFPDVIRRVSRVVSRIYTHPDDWEETKISIADCLSVLNNRNYYLGACVAARHYGERGHTITPEEISSMLWFLHRCTHDSSKKPKLQNKYLIECLNIENIQYD